MTPSLPLRMLSLALSVAAVGACAGSKSSSGGTGTGTGAAGSGGCQTSACVGALPAPVSWAIEIDPPGTSAAALTELPPRAIGADALNLTADSQSAVDATFMAAASGTVPSMATVVLTYPPLIGGRPDLTFEAASTLNSATTTLTAILPVPAAASGRSGTLQLVPLSPADRQSPPISFPVTVPSSSPANPGILTETLPATYLSIAGTLLSAIGTAPSATFIARAFQAGTQVSTAPFVGTDGSFQLLMPPGAANASVVVQLTPQDPDDPWYATTAIMPTANLSLGTITLPAYSDPNFFTLTVTGMDDPTATVSGAFVRAKAKLGSSPAGETDYLRAGTTGTDGTVTLSLLPGTATQAREYDLTVIPPAGSPYAIGCSATVGVTVGGTAASPVNLMTIPLPRRPVLTGTVKDAAGLPVAHVAITATAGPAPAGVCAPAVSASVLAGDDGSFNLPLDPGTYQLDYDPPAGSAAPRQTELAVLVSADLAEIAHDVTLPKPALVQGNVVLGPGGPPVASATVRIFEVRCTSQAGDCSGPARTAPWLRGQTTTDASGAFRVVVPVPAASN